MEKVGVYISGLGQSFQQESFEKYAIRLKNEFRYSDNGSEFELKTEKIFYTEERDSTVVSIFKYKKDNPDNAERVYKLYDFKYHEILTERFKKQNLLLKNLILLGLILKKLPQLFLRIFSSGSFSRPYLTFYAFLVLLVISLAIIFLIPASIDIVTQYGAQKEIKTLIESCHLDFEKITGFLSGLTQKTKWFVPITTFILLVIPESKTLLTSLATEFVCVDQYIENGEQSQLVLGNLDLLIEYIAENDPKAQIHYHSYSFGTIIAMDFLFPIGNVPSANTKDRSELLVTIGTPYEFINAYYPKFFNNRSAQMETKLTWMNVYSIADALATNFRKDTNRGPALFGINGISLLPININYEVTSDKSMTLFNFITMYAIRMHKCYWDASPNGQSCIRVLSNEMKARGFI